MSKNYSVGNPSLQTISFRLRTKLSSKQPKRAGLWSILRKFVGADLGKISLPVLLNEPITFLQRICEPLDNIGLLLHAVDEPDPLKRMSLVVAFVMASYGVSDDRMWKPFNPLLGETYEVQRQSFRAICEQISHHPPITAFHAEARDIQFYGWFSPSFKLAGTSMHIRNNGSLCIVLTNLNEVFTWSVDDVLTRVNNLMFGKMYLENVGTIMIRNHTSGYKAQIAFLTNDHKRNISDRAEGFIKDDRGNKRLFVYGKCSRFIKAVDMDSYRAYAYAVPNRFDGRILSYFSVPQRSTAAYHLGRTKEVVQEKNKDSYHPINIPNSVWLWMSPKLPPYRELYFNFTYFALTLNEIEPYMKVPGVLCPTDSRFRPDVRSYENGNVDAAELIKTKLENSQRSRAKTQQGLWQPRWFYSAISPLTGEEYWPYGGNYWNRQYPYDEELKDIFNIRR